MEKHNSYDNHLISFKKNLWDECIQRKIFNNIPQSEFENIKKMFEDNVENYKMQILQDNNLNSVTQVLLERIGKDAELLKNVTNEQIKNSKKDLFETALKEKQDEYNSLISKPVPETPDFSDGSKDEPLDNDNLESLIQQHMKERDLAINITPKNVQTADKEENNIAENNIAENNTEKNQIVMTNQFSEDNNNNSRLIEMIEQIHSENTSLKEQLYKLENVINKQNVVLNSIVNSQITILKKIK